MEQEVCWDKKNPSIMTSEYLILGDFVSYFGQLIDFSFLPSVSSKWDAQPCNAEWSSNFLAYFERTAVIIFSPL